MVLWFEEAIAFRGVFLTKALQSSAIAVRVRKLMGKSAKRHL